MTIIDIEAIEHLDFDVSEEDACEAEGCDETPVWLLTLTCCFFSVKICDTCLGKHERWLSLMELFDTEVTHSPCGTTWKAKEMHDKQVVMPL